MGNSSSTSGPPGWGDCTSGSHDSSASVVESIPAALGFSDCCKKNDESQTQAIVEVPIYTVAGGTDGLEFFSSVQRHPGSPVQNYAHPKMMQASIDDINRFANSPRSPRTSPMSSSSDLSQIKVEGAMHGDQPEVMDPSLLLLPNQCCCFPNAINKPSESTMLKKPWCIYCCCCGCGCEPALQPIVQRLDCACCHTSFESAYCLEPAQGCCSNVWTCCNASWLCQCPIAMHAPCCICCNERCCFRGGKPDQQAMRKRRASVEQYEEAKYIVEERWVPCLCGPCACTESYGRRCFGYATKCCCTRCDGGCGPPMYPGCALLSLCCCSYCQCRCPSLAAGTPCVVCCTIKLESCFKCRRGQFCGKRCPGCCEKCKCCSCSEVCSWCRRWTEKIPSQQEMK